MIGVDDLAIYLLSAMNTFYPQSNHAFMEKPKVTQERYEEFAKDIAKVVLDPRVKPLFAGEDGPIKTGLLLIAIARYESSFRNDVMTCTKLGDKGWSFGPFQAQGYAETVCQGNFQAAWVAIEMIHESFKICHNLPMNYHLAEYTDGNNWDSPRAFKRSSDRMDTAIHYFTSHKVISKSN